MSNRHFKAYQVAVAMAVLLLSASCTHAEVFTSFRFTRIRGSNQVIAVPTTYVIPRYRALPSRFGPETWEVRLRGRNGFFTESYQVGNSALAMQRARRAYPSAAILSVRKK